MVTYVQETSHVEDAYHEYIGTDKRDDKTVLYHVPLMSAHTI